MKIRITGRGIYGAKGEIEIGTELTVQEAPAGWAGRYEVVSKEPAKDAEAVTNPADGDKQPARRNRAKADS